MNQWAEIAVYAVCESGFAVLASLSFSMGLRPIICLYSLVLCIYVLILSTPLSPLFLSNCLPASISNVCWNAIVGIADQAPGTRTIFSACRYLPCCPSIVFHMFTVSLWSAVGSKCLNCIWYA